MAFRFLISALALCLSVGSAFAQNTATPVVTGYLSTSGCASAALTPCFIQFGAGGGGGGGGSVTQGTVPWVVSGQGTAGSAATGVVTVQGIASGTTLPVTMSSAYPVGATAITASATGTTAATTATLAGTSGKTTYICSYSVRANATAAATVTDTLTGVITATMSSLLWVAPLASGLGVDEQIFTPCVPASGTNVGIAVVSGAPGTGGTVSVHATGYQQ